MAGRCGLGGRTVSKRKLDEFRKKYGFAGYIDTDAKGGSGCDELKALIAKHIPWDRLPWTSTTKLFKTLKDAIVGIKGKSAGDESEPAVVRLAELRQRLQLMLPGETFTEAELRTVVGLLAGQGLVKALDFGDFILLQPERLNAYAAAVVRTAREHTDEIGCVLEREVLEGRIDPKDMPRLPKPEEEIVLRAMTQTFLDRSLCLRQETPVGEMLVFPSYFNRDKPDVPEHPSVFVSYSFAGPLDEIYSTLVVRLHYTEPFKMKDLWRNAADFVTHEDKRVGLKMDKKEEGKGEIVVYCEPDVPLDTQVSFIKYTHEHLLKRAKDVVRVRSYVCPKCHEPVEPAKAMKRREAGKKDIFCTECGQSIQLDDLIEQKAASPEFQRRVREMDEQATIALDNESRELILVGHAYAIAGEAGQIYRQYTNSDHGIDGEIEFKNDKGEASGRRVYLQLKSGDSYLYRRERDDKDIFTIKKERHAEYWQAQAYPVMLVIRTSDGSIRWMDVTEYLKKQRGAGGKPPKQVGFYGEPFTAMNLVRLKDRVMKGAASGR